MKKADSQISLNAHLRTSRAWNIHTSNSARKLLNLNPRQALAILNKMEEISKELHEALIVEMQNIAAQESECLFNNRIIRFVQDSKRLGKPEIWLHSGHEITQRYQDFKECVNLNILESNDIVMRFFFPKPLEQFWRNRNGKPHVGPLCVYEWGVLYLKLRTLYFWPMVNASDTVWFTRINAKRFHLPGANGFNYLFKLRA